MTTSFSLKFTFCLVFRDRVSLWSPGWPQTHKLPTSASGVLGLQMCTTNQPAGHFSDDFVESAVMGVRLTCLLPHPHHLRESPGRE
jgi:hypothetical protein